MQSLPEDCEAVMTWLWIAAMVVIDGAAGLSGAVIPERWLERYRAPLLGFATGALLASGLGEVLPEAVERGGPWILCWAAGAVAVLAAAERFVSRRRGPVAPAALLASDALHNIGDGMAIAAAFLVSIHLGIVTSFAVIVHEVPEEVADYALLRTSGVGKRGSLLALAAVQLTAGIGAAGTVLAASSISHGAAVILALAGGTFVYIAAIDLVPELIRSRLDRRSSHRSRRDRGTRRALVGTAIAALRTYRPAIDPVMPYAKNSDLPPPLRKALPSHAQDIYRAAFNDAYAHYGSDREPIAHRVAWAAVKRRYVHITGGVWVPRSKRA